MSKTSRNLSFMVLVALMSVATTTGCGKKPDSTPSENRTGDGNTSAGSDLDRLQGVWAVESWDIANEEPKDKDGKVDAKQKAMFEDFKKEFLNAMKNARFQFQGNKLGILVEDRWERGSIKLDEKSNPKGIILTHLDEKGEPMKIVGKERPNDEAIYKFEGDLLVIALPMGDGSRPTEFKPRADNFDEKTKKREAGVAVVTLKKTNEPIKDTTSKPSRTSGTTAASSRPRPGTSK
jgi:uncharacterized protein (TIGR03067 family)